MEDGTIRFDRPELYFNAGQERMKQAWLLYLHPEGQNHALSMYAAGLAVECTLRAFKMLRDPTFDERHDLRLLFKASGMLDVDPDSIARAGLSASSSGAYFRELQVAVSIVCILWLNEYRFASESHMRAYIKGIKLDRRIKGDPLKYNARRLIEAAQFICSRGVRQWNL